MATLTAAAVAGVMAWRRRAAGRGEQWSCECGQRYVARGLDRHRMYWPADAPHAEPLLGRECIRCGRPLPATHEAALSSRAPAVR